MVMWIIGLSGAGKTTLANAILEEVRLSRNNIVLIDGDLVREAFGNDLGHSLDDRKKNAYRISRMCKFLDDQGIDVICSILSLFPESREWNRKNIIDYYQVYIKAPIRDLKHRDYKGLYKKFENGEIKNLAGLDIKFIEPKNSNIEINNNKKVEDLLAYTNQLSALFDELQI